MMAVTNLPIANGFYVSESLPISNQRCVNFYPNIPQAPSVTVDNLFPTPGLVQITSGSSLATPNVGKICRGGIVLQGKPYLIIGNSFWRIDQTIGPPETFTAVQITGVIDGVERCILAQNGTQIAIVAPPDSATSGETHIYDIGTGNLTEVTDANFDGPASYVEHIDGYFVFIKAESKKFFNSPLNDGRGNPPGVAYNALDFSLVNAEPNKLVSLIEHKNQLYAMGEQKTVIYRNIGRTPAPFAPISGAVVDIGVKAPYTVTEYAGAISFVGGAVSESPSIWLLSGGSKTKLSTTAIDNELSKLTVEELSGVFSWVYSESGAFFLGITTPYTTFVHDLVNSRWHERNSLVNTSLSANRVAVMLDAYARIIVGDIQNTNIGVLSEDIYTEYGQIMRRFVTSQPFDDFGQRRSVSMIEAVVENGVGLPNDVTISGGISEAGEESMVTGGKDPQITLSWSDDGGRTFVGDLSRSLGKMGEYKIRPIWYQLGDFPRSRVIRLEISAPVDAVIIKIEADIS